MSSHDKFVDPPVVPVDKEKIKKIWKTAGILGFITAIEFAIAFSPASHGFKAFTFVALTIVKAFFIVAEFMHLGHEKKTLVYAILLPLMFLVWGIIAFLQEANTIFEATKSLWGYYQ